jgi:hypothetical protein
MKILITFLFILFSTLGKANTISVGDVELNIPNPRSYSPVTPQMVALYEFQKQFVAASNKEFITFIPDDGVSIAQQNEIPNFDRRFSVQTSKPLVNQAVPKSFFIELKDTFKTKNTDIIKKAEKEIAVQMNSINSDISKKHKIDMALSVSQVLPEPVYIETERSLAYSSYVKYNINDEFGNPSSYISLVTATFVYVKGKILFLYSYAGESDLEWSQNISQQWANAVIEANPPDFTSSLNEMLPSSITGINWDKVGEKAIFGALTGLVFGLIGLVFGLISWLVGEIRK